MNARARLLVVLALVIAALCWWLAFSRPPAPVSVVHDQPLAHSAQPVEPSPAVGQAPAQPPPSLPATPASAPPPELAAPAAAVQTPDTRGFVDALQQRYEADGVDREAGAAEADLRRLFERVDAPPSLLRSVMCRRSVCKLELRWVAASDAAYRQVTAALMGDNAKFFATRAQEPDRGGAVLVDAYWIRRPPPAR